MILTSHFWKFNFDTLPGESRLIIRFGEERAYVGKNPDDPPVAGWFTLWLECHSAVILRGEEV